jgi:hypothetical protein
LITKKAFDIPLFSTLVRIKSLGCLIVKEQLQLSDCETVQMIREQYIQYFLGYAEYRYDISLDPLLTYFRKRFPADVVAQVNQWVVDAARLQESEEENDDEEGGHGGNVPDEPDSVPESENHGTLRCKLCTTGYPVPDGYTALA